MAHIAAVGWIRSTPAASHVPVAVSHVPTHSPPVQGSPAALFDVQTPLEQYAPCTQRDFGPQGLPTASATHLEATVSQYAPC